MTELGRLLVEARTAKELSVADVEKATRIRQKYVEALENGTFSALPRGAVARGFLRNYAVFLGLDMSDVLRRYAQESGDSSEAVDIAEVGKPRLVDYRPVEVALVEERRDLGWRRWLIALLLVGAIVTAGWWFLSQNPGWRPLAAFGPAPTATYTATARPTATRWIVTATPPPQPSPQPVQPTVTSDLLTLPIPTVPPTVTPTPRPTATPEVVARISLTIRVGQRAWMRVTADGAVVIEETVEAGQTRSWEANSTMKIMTGNAGGIEMVLNNQELGKMGGVGQVVERAWVVDKGQVTETQSGTPTKAPARTVTPTPSG